MISNDALLDCEEALCHFSGCTVMSACDYPKTLIQDRYVNFTYS